MASAGWPRSFPSTFVSADYAESDAARDAILRRGPRNGTWFGAGRDRSSVPLHFRMTEIDVGDGIRQSGQRRAGGGEQLVQRLADFAGAWLAEHAGVGAKQVRRRCFQTSLFGKRPGSPRRPAGEVPAMLPEIAYLEGKRAWIGLVVQQQIEHRRGLQHREIAGAVSHGTVANLQQHFERGPGARAKRHDERRVG